MNLSNQLLKSVIHLNIIYNDESSFEATGVLFNFQLDNENSLVTILCNKHIFVNADTLQIKFKLPDGHFHQYNFENIQNSVILHPNPKINLGIIPINNLITDLIEKELIDKIAPLDNTLIPSTEDLNSLGAIEDVVIPYFPKGIYDISNNMPIVLTGITTSDYKKDYFNLKTFLINTKFLKGISGAPVFIYNNGQYYENGELVFSSRLWFLGVITETFVKNNTNQYSTQFIDKNTDENETLDIMLVLKSELIREFKPIVEKVLE